MNAINNSISYQSQFSTSNSALNDMRTKSGAQSQMEMMKGVDLQSVSPKYLVQSVPALNQLGKHINLKA
jgi:hypothetical protein